MHYLSVCSGIEAATAAWHPLGWTPTAFAEVAAFPSAVLAHHYPAVPNLGDLNAFADWPEQVFADSDVIVGGPPCQAFSVAGLRASLSDARGNLTLTYVRLIDHADAIRRQHGRPPVIVVYENVPGLLTTGDNAFGCLVGALAGSDGPVETETGKWPAACVLWGQKRRVGYRILDAQYFGLAQRRRRVFVVAVPNELVDDLGDRLDPAELLSVAESLRGDSPPRRDQGQGAAADAGAGAGASHWDGDYPHPTLNQSNRANGAPGQSNQELFSKRGSYLVAGHPVDANGLQQVVGALCADTHPGAYSGQDAYTGRLVPTLASQAGVIGNGDAAPCVAFSCKDDGRDVTPDCAPTLHAMAHSDSHANGGGQLAVCFKASHFTRGKDGAPNSVTPPLSADADKGDQDTLLLVPISCDGTVDGPVPPLMARSSRGGAQTLSPGFQTDGHMLGIGMAVRRLTPRECERLQGFPDDYTLILQGNGKPAADGPRYRALGNSMAVPVMAWIGRRIDAAMKEAA